MLQDIAILTGAQVVSDDLGLKLNSIDMSVLGQAKKVIVSKDETTIVSGAGSKDDVEARVSQIRAEIDNTDSDYDREKLQERLAKLAGGVAVITSALPPRSRPRNASTASRTPSATRRLLSKRVCCLAVVSRSSKLPRRLRALLMSRL